MREGEMGHRRWVALLIGLVVVVGLAGCGSASSRAVPAKTSSAGKAATVSNWKPRLGHNEARRIYECLANAGDTAFVSDTPGGRSLAAFLPHLLYFATATYGMPGGDAYAEVTIYIFDSSSTAERWARVAQASGAAGVIKSGGFGHGANSAHSQVLRRADVVSTWFGSVDAFGSYRDVGRRCANR